jgi:hypothetical protein
VEFLDEPVAGLCKRAIATVHHEFEEVAFGSADKTFEDAFLLAEVQRGMFIVMIRAEGSAAFIAQAFQLESKLVGHF